MERQLRKCWQQGGRVLCISAIYSAIAKLTRMPSVRVCVADMNLDGARATVEKVGKGAFATQVSVADWDSQVASFTQAVKEFGRIDYVFPIAGIGERKVIRNDPTAIEFEKPDLSVIDVDLTGLMYTCFLAIQQMRRQEKDSTGYRGRSELGPLYTTLRSAHGG